MSLHQVHRVPGVRTARGHARPRLVADTIAVDRLDAATREDAWALFARVYAGADRARFDRDLADKHTVIVLRDPGTGTLRGFSTVHVGEVETSAGRGPATVVFSGDTAIDPAYWGAKALQRAFSLLLVRCKLRHPARPLYWFLICKGYKTYLMLAHACPRSLPRYDRPADPELHRVRDLVASARFGADYDPTAGVIRYAQAREHVRAGLCPVGPELLADPHIAFFVERNPGYGHGDELACLAEIRLRDPLRQIARSVWRRARRPAGSARRSGATDPARSPERSAR